VSEVLFHPPGDLKPHERTVVPPLEKEDLELLEKDVAQHGIRIPLAITPERVILDGHHRWQIAQKLKLATVPCQVFKFKSKEEEEEFIITVNLARRHLTTAQKAVLGLALLEIERKKAKERQRQHGFTAPGRPKTLPQNFGEVSGEAPDLAASKVGISGETLRKAAFVVEKKPEYKEKLLEGKVSVDRAYREVRKEVIRKEAQEKGKRVSLPEDVLLLPGDFRVLSSRIPDESVNLIFTDPPYAREYIPLYEDIAKVASRVLVPGGSLLVYAGHYALPEIFKLMCPHLTYWWIICSYQQGPNAFNRGIYIKWKPILWFVKQPFQALSAIPDVLKPSLEKEHHDWQQSLKDAEFIIEKLTLPGDTIFDPLCGSGTTGVAAVKLGRRFIGFDSDESALLTAKQRISEACERT